MPKHQLKAYEPKENTDMSATGKVIRKGTRSFITEALPDDPVYPRGFVVGGKYSRGSSKRPPKK